MKTVNFLIGVVFLTLLGVAYWILRYIMNFSSLEITVLGLCLVALTLYVRSKTMKDDYAIEIYCLKSDLKAAEEEIKKLEKHIRELLSANNKDPA
ncbi:MAG: hypothetical protein LBE54_02225 [Brucellaceae bacterium]|jgi:hypothetical protein|nr:hypothetical protein [Brucellaceae bacterium]